MAKTVVILGGGPCGLSAAWELTTQGDNVTVLEQDTKLGGLSSTTEYRGFRFDLGGHRFISPDQQLVDKVCALMQQDLLVQTRKSVIMLGGQQFTYPLSAREVFSTTGLRFGTYAFVDYLMHNAMHRLGRRSDQSFEEWVVNRFGRHLYSTFFGPYTEKLWGLAPQQLSSDWAAQRISLLNLGDAFWRLFGIGRGTPRTYAKKYYYPKKGIGQLFERIGEVVEQQGGHILSPARVRRVHVRQDRVTGWNLTMWPARISECDALISTLPLPELVRMLTPSVAPEALAASAQLRFRSLRFLNLLVDQPEISGNTWTYVSEQEVPHDAYPGAEATESVQCPERSNLSHAGNSVPGRRRHLERCGREPVGALHQRPLDAWHRYSKARDRLFFNACPSCLSHLSTRIQSAPTNAL